MMAAVQNDRPLPPQPGPQQQFPYPQHQQPPPPPSQPQQFQQLPQPQARPAPEKSRPRSRAFSFRSDKSQKSAGGSHHQSIDLLETHAEKDAKRLHTKADPTFAMNEAEPSAVAALEKSSMAPLRAMPHRDTFGNPIADPDRSNPTRSRWERPLDTIRSFEAAIDGGYSNRKSYIRSDSDSVANWNRRSSYYGNNTSRFPQDSYYGGRPNSFMPSSSQYDLRANTPGRESYFDGPQGPNPHNNNAMAQGRQRYSRMASEPHFNTAYKQAEQNTYPLPLPNGHRSYETVASGSGSGTSGEPAGYQTDPTSSDNSSIERIQSPPKPEPVNDYGIGFNQSPTYQPSAFTVGVNGNGPKSPMNPGRMVPQQNQYVGPPPVPRKDPNAILRKPTRQPSMEQAQPRPVMGEKRKSWFARRFSKQG